MARFFDSSTPVIHQGARSSPQRWAHGRRWLLWPAFAWQVVAVEPRKGSLNLFQRHVLSLCQAGVRDKRDIGERLAFGAELAAFIIFQLRSMALLDTDGSPTARGIRLLAEEQDDQLDAVSGHVFQDPFTFRLWQRFVPGNLNYLDASIRNVIARFSIGGRKKQRQHTANVMFPRGLQTPWPPSPSAILRACLKSRQRRLAFERSLKLGHGGNEDFLFTGGEIEALTERITLVDERPEPVFVTTFVFVPEDIQRASLWQVCDPFGLGISTDLRRDIEMMIDRGEASWLQGLIEKVTGQAYAVESQDVYELVAAAKKQAVRAVSSRLGAADTLSRDLVQRLVQMEEKVADARKHRPNSARSRALRKGPLQSFARRAYAAAEELLAGVVDAFCQLELTHVLVESAEDNGHLLSSIARKIGFVDDPDDACFESLLRVKPGSVYAAMEHGNRNLAAQVGAALLVANSHSGHPFHAAARTQPEMLVFLERLKGLRDPAAHDADDTLPDERVDWVLEGIYSAVGCLLPESIIRPEAPAGERAYQEPEWSARVMYRLRAQAVADVDREMGLAVRDFQDLRHRLVDMLVVSHELDHLRRAAADHLDVSGRLNDLVIQGATVIEAGFKALLKSTTTAGCADDLSEDRAKNAIRYNQIAQSLGFTLADGGSLEQQLVTAHPKRVQAAAESGQGSLGALTVVALLSAQLKDDHPLHRIASQRPDLLLDVGEIVRARGHGDRANVDPHGVVAFRNRVLAVARTIIDGLS